MIYRRIEVDQGIGWYGPNCMVPWSDLGLPSLRRKRRKIARSGGRFWWTDKGWRKIGKVVLARVIALCRKEGYRYRLLTVDYRKKAIARDCYQVVLPV